jgi:hypothetical protein
MWSFVSSLWNTSKIHSLGHERSQGGGGDKKWAGATQGSLRPASNVAFSIATKHLLLHLVGTCNLLPPPLCLETIRMPVNNRDNQVVGQRRTDQGQRTAPGRWGAKTCEGGGLERSKMTTIGEHFSRDDVKGEM